MSQLRFDWPEGAQATSCRVRIQLDPFGPWLERPVTWNGAFPEVAPLGTFDRPTPVSYRVDAALADGQTVELWGYFQVRTDARTTVIPPFPLPDLATAGSSIAGGVTPLPDLTAETELLPLIDPDMVWSHGDWIAADGRLTSPKAYGARIEIPFDPPPEYELTVIAEPLDPPNGLILGQRMGDHRFLVLVNYTPDDAGLSALENVDGGNVRANATTRTGDLLKQGRPAEIVVTVRNGRVTVRVDTTTLVDW